jgi:hypothetical protein
MIKTNIIQIKILSSQENQNIRTNGNIQNPAQIAINQANLFNNLVIFFVYFIN